MSEQAGTAIRIRGLGREYGDRTALDGVDLDLDFGQTLAVLGPNGSGKTTLINCITGFLKPDRGRIFFKGKEITGAPP
ncbi:MAG: ATP-binding cassette domain-containing protein, partial [Acidobacteriota bacterium]